MEESFRRLANLLRESIITTEEARDMMESMGYQEGNINLEGPRMEVRMPVETGARFSRGDPVVMAPNGDIRPAREGELIIGVALEDSIMRIGADLGGHELRVMVAGQLGRGDIMRARDRMRADGYEADYVLQASVAHASVAYQGSVLGADWGGVGRRTFAAHNRYQYTKKTERFPKEITEKAWKLLEEYMTADQHFAFMEGANVELQNRNESYRLLIRKTGDFTILQGATGAGIVATSGRINGWKYPLGDEIAAFLDWFNHKTEDLIAQWNCGAYSIRKEDELHRR